MELQLKEKRSQSVSHTLFLFHTELFTNWTALFVYFWWCRHLHTSVYLHLGKIWLHSLLEKVSVGHGKTTAFFFLPKSLQAPALPNAVFIYDKRNWAQNACVDSCFYFVIKQSSECCNVKYYLLVWGGFCQRMYIKLEYITFHSLQFSTITVIPHADPQNEVVGGKIGISFRI